MLFKFFTFLRQRETVLVQFGKKVAVMTLF